MVELKNQLAEGIRQLGLVVDQTKADQLMLYLTALIKWNKTYNLTAITDPGQMVMDHLLDALSVLPTVSKPNRLLDIGTGGGIPGMILAICLPETQVTLLDSNGKKTAFLRQVVIELGLKNITVAHCRVEEFRAELFDIIISRAFSSLPLFVTLSAALLSKTGRWFAMKGKSLTDEMDALGDDYLIEENIALSVPGSQAERHLMIVKRKNDS